MNQQVVKHVTFNNVVIVRTMRVWVFASRMARISSWQFTYANNLRFQRRCKQVEESISYIFNPTHRRIMRKYIHNESKKVGYERNRTSESKSEHSQRKAKGKAKYHDSGYSTTSSESSESSECSSSECSSTSSECSSTSFSESSGDNLGDFSSDDSSYSDSDDDQECDSFLDSESDDELRIVFVE